MKPERVIQLLQVEKDYTLKQTGHSQQPINKEVAEALDIAINAVGAIEQVRWERDTAIEQLNSYGVGLCENADVQKIVRCEDCKYAFQHFQGHIYCHRDGRNSFEMTFQKHDFCSYGERKADNG